MVRKRKEKLSNLLDFAKEDILEHNHTNQGFIPDIITFCESPEYLDLPSQGIALRPFQSIILKVFYRGSRGNENLELTDEEIELLKKHGLDGSTERGNVLGKYKSGEIFRELVLIWGRRSGKDFLVSIIATYEAMRLLEVDNGDPYSYYGLADAAPISILTVATSSDQAQRAFQEIKSKVLQSKYFKERIGPNGLSEANSIYLVTPKDRENNKDLKERGFPLKKGSIVVEVGHSNSDSLLGKGIFVLILDEVASYKMTGSAASGDRIYTGLVPATYTYSRQVPVFDEDGNHILNDQGELKYKVEYDSKVISISSPRGEDGIFYKLYREREKAPKRLVCQLPTWAVCPHMTQESLRESNPQMSEDEFMSEFGAQFSGTGGMNFFPRQNVESCFVPGLQNKKLGKPGNIYFAHLDPATSSHNYALIVCHKEVYKDKETQKKDYYIVVDHIKYWSPKKGKPIEVDEVDEYMLQLRRRFFLGMVTYDTWNSANSIKKLREAGIPCKCTHFSGPYKMRIYSELYNLVTSCRLRIPLHPLLRAEMFGLQRRFTPRGFTVYPNPEGDCKTDDLVDALAGASYNVINHSFNTGLPSGQVAQVSATSPQNHRMWKTMSGPMGFGTGKQVSDFLRRKGI